MPTQATTPAVAACETWDSKGEHGEAIKALVSGVNAGDLSALLVLGKRLLIGDRAPFLPKEAAGLLQEAMDKGSAEAAALLGVLHALGYFAAPDLAKSLSCLVAAASLGLLTAQQQLEILGGGVCDLRNTAVAKPLAHWRDLAAAVDLRVWLQVPGVTDICAGPRICSFPGFVSPAVCKWLMAKAAPLLQRAQVYDAVSKTTEVHGTRTNKAATFNLLDTDLVSVLLQTKMSRSTGIPIRHFEAATVLHYDVGEQIRNHFDFIDPNSPGYEQQISQHGQRVITFLVYLNADYSGGATHFPKLDIGHQGRAGEGLFFVNSLPDGRPDLRTLHAGRPVLEGHKWVVSQFIRSLPVF